MKIIVVIPTYNEANNVPPLAAELWGLDIPNLSILVVDDNSPDGTADVVDDLVEHSRAEISVMRRPGKMGLGTAYRDGFKKAIEMGADVIIQMDADFSHSPSYIPKMLEELQNCDCVVGSRYVEGGSLDERWSLGRYLLSWWANSIYTRLILGTRQRDTTAGFKAWRRETLQGMGLDRVHSNGYDFQVEMTYLAEKLGYLIVEIPIHFEDRRIGQSKMNMKVKLESALKVWNIMWRHRRLRPQDRMPIAPEIIPAAE
ncbi:MAG: polyprenol monophosphomannose synthase [Anaerolineae bacterium]|nr:polyprenol monophosphomannose synthase [Anaerolineae bacterium]